MMRVDDPQLMLNAACENPNYYQVPAPSQQSTPAATVFESYNPQMMMMINNNNNNLIDRSLEAALRRMNLSAPQPQSQPPPPSTLWSPPPPPNPRFPFLPSNSNSLTVTAPTFPSSPHTSIIRDNDELYSFSDFSKNQHYYLNNNNYYYSPSPNYNDISSWWLPAQRRTMPSSFYNPRRRKQEEDGAAALPPPPPSAYYSEEELRGSRIVELAKGKDSCKALQAMWASDSKSEKGELIFQGVKTNLNELMEDQYGSHLVQKIFELSSYDQISQILFLFSADGHRFVDTCVNQHGTRAVQRMIEHIQGANQGASLIYAIKHAIIRLCKDQHGQHVVQQCLKCFAGNDAITYVLDKIAEHVVDLSMDKSGCCVVQAALTYAKVYREAQLLERLSASIVANSLILSEHPFGNYVVQYLIELKIDNVNTRIVNKLSGNQIRLSMSKYASNVVEKCLRVCGDRDKAKIINEIMTNPDFLYFLQDPYGNYVAQTALKRSEGLLQNALANMVQEHYPYLHSHLHGRKVLACTRGNKHRSTTIDIDSNNGFRRGSF